MTSVAEAPTTSAPPELRRRILAMAVTATALTLFDAAASWFSIVHLQIAAEGNGLLDMLGSAIGFEAALAVRFVWGAGLTLILAYLAIVQFRRHPERRRPLAYHGLFVVTGVLGVLAIWHVVVLVLGAPRG
ncbi:MAG: hypothetical protein J0J04_08330 [Microbacterium sp.]|uniref:hypothetical protein n=1 Tax=Microbacterium sp. TaxID=51671 RepID=UPI001ACB5459|nr:hypothetical protein [Microbacterium sp.]MBN9214808.1 hypothetical protein [Microbacterium sp.]